MIYLSATILLGISFCIVGIAMNARFYFAPILGFMMGALYSYTDQPEGREHTMQVTIAFLSITIQWEDLG